MLERYEWHYRVVADAAVCTSTTFLQTTWAVFEIKRLSLEFHVFKGESELTI